MVIKLTMVVIESHDLLSFLTNTWGYLRIKFGGPRSKGGTRVEKNRGLSGGGTISIPCSSSFQLLPKNFGLES